MNRLQRPDGVTLAFQVHNPQAPGVPLLLTHGFGATAGMWDRNVDALSVDRPVIVWDQRGHGSSDAPDDPACYTAEACVADMGEPPRRVVLGRPAFFVDDDPEADRRAERQLEGAAAAAGFADIAFQFEPIAAALDYERSVTREEIALVADIGGGTSDFSVVRVSPERRLAADRKADILS